MDDRRSRETDRPSRGLAGTVVLALALAGLGASCGGGNIPTRGDPTLAFGGEPVNAPGVHLRTGLGGSGRLLEILVVAEGLVGAYAVEYDLHYPTEVLSFSGFEEGIFLSERQRFPTRLSVAETSPGVLHVEHRRVGDVGPVREGLVSEPMQILRFTAHTSGTGSFFFTGNRVLDENGDELPGVTWGTGTVQVF